MNSNENSILIVDSNKAFATILKEGLEQDSGYRATIATSGDEALQALAAAEFDLAIVDLGMTDPDGAMLARTLRRQRSDLRLMLIPLEGEDLPPELADLDVQGVLPKPFFFPELPGRVADALGWPEVAEAEGPGIAEAVEPAIAPARPAVSGEDRLAVLREHLGETIQEMSVLSQEINAEAVILTCGGKLLAHTGRLSAEEADRLAQVAGESWRTSARVAQILGREQLRFEQSVEGGEHLFYSLAIAEDIILSVALRANIPLGMIRHRAKETAETLRTLIGVAQ
ncbi:MAG: response regulator [Anaerolineae bacterium]